MERRFANYRPVSKSVLDELWRTALVTFDTSVLLNVYEFTPDGRKEFFSVLQRLKELDRLWLSNQVIEEFHRNRLKVAVRRQRALLSTKSLIKTFSNNLKEQFPESPETRALHDAVAEASQQIEDYVKKFSVTNNSHPLPEQDSVLSQLWQIFDSEHLIGKPLGKKKSRRVVRDGARRFRKGVPPGFADDAKFGDGKYGDLMVWEELIRYSQRNGIGVILVTDDGKEDWWFSSGKLDKSGNPLLDMPHPLLVEEFQRRTGNTFWMYRTDTFLGLSGQKLQEAVSRGTIQEAREAREPERTWFTDSYLQHTSMLRTNPFRVHSADYEPLLRALEGIALMPDGETWLQLRNIRNRLAHHGSSSLSEEEISTLKLWLAWNALEGAYRNLGEIASEGSDSIGLDSDAILDDDENGSS